MRKRSNEPVFWSLFGAGGVVTALLAPALVLVTGLAGPLGLLGADALAYDRVMAFAGSLVGKLFLFGVISLTFWHAFHRVYHSLHDLGFYQWLRQRGVDHGHGLFAAVFYGLAAVGSIAALVVLGRLG